MYAYLRRWSEVLHSDTRGARGTMQNFANLFDSHDVEVDFTIAQMFFDFIAKNFGEFDILNVDFDDDFDFHVYILPS